MGHRLIGVSQVWARADEHPALGDYLPPTGGYRITIQGEGGFVDAQTS